MVQDVKRREQEDYERKLQEQENFQKKQKRKNAKKLPQREYIDFDVFKSTLELAEKNIKDETTKARVLIGLILLY